MTSTIIADLDKRIARIPQHGQALPQESDSPIEHYRRGSLDALSLVQYFHRNMGRVNVYRVPYERHSARLHAMVLLTLVETFERFLKELAAVCVDQISGLVLDDRLAKFTANGTAIALTFGQGTVGRLLCESLLWTDVNTIDDRFKKVLEEESHKPFSLFPSAKNDPDLWRRRSLEILFQLRHSIVHNASVLTVSDAAKLRILGRATVEAPRVLAPTQTDLGYVKSFLDGTAEWCDERVEKRLTSVLDKIHQSDNALFDPQERANALSKAFRRQVTIAGKTGEP